MSFDRAAGYYDQTRAFPDEVMRRLIPMLAAQLGADEPCLEIGVGTGRIALPLREEGVQIVGLDISMEMVRKLIDKAGGITFRALLADATQLPFGDNTFGSAVAAHVLHLIPQWKRAVDELARVVRPGGVVVASRGAMAVTDWNRAVSTHFFKRAGDPPWPPGMDKIDQLDLEMHARDATVRELGEFRTESDASINDLLANLEDGIWSACWAIDASTRRRAAAATREWARSELGDLDAPRMRVESSVWRAYTLS